MYLKPYLWTRNTQSDIIYSDFYRKMRMILDGKALALEKEAIIRKTCVQKSLKPTIAFIRIGSDIASQIYVSKKAEHAEKAGIRSKVFAYPNDVSESTIVTKINECNIDPLVDGILVQLPLPKHLDTDIILNTISPHKDVDGLNDVNVGKLSRNNAPLIACTPKGIVSLLEHYNIPLRGQHVVIIGRSRIVGKPMAQCMLNKNATVTVCHSHSKNIDQLVSHADIVVCATGTPNCIKAEWIRDHAVVIDVGIHRADGKITGDIDLSGHTHRLKAYTPVPGGVGPMTICSLLENTLIAHQT